MCYHLLFVDFIVKIYYFSTINPQSVHKCGKVYSFFINPHPIL